MRPRSLLTASLLVALPLAMVAGQDKKSSARLPLNPFAKAAKGDWCVLKKSTKTSSAGVDMAGSFFVSLTVKEIKGDQVVIAHHQQTESGRNPTDSELTLSRKQPPSVNEYVLGLRDSKIDQVKVKDDKHASGGREFDCKQLDFTTKDEGGEGVETIWISERVKGYGLVARKSQWQTGTGKSASKITTTVEVVGFGSAGKTEWGRSFADLLGEKASGKKAE